MIDEFESRIRNDPVAYRECVTFEVERILKRRRTRACTTYLVKWAGFSKSYNSWEPLENLMSFRDKIMDFELKQPRTSEVLF